MVEINYTLLIGSTLLILGVGVAIYYKDDLYNIYEMKKEESKISKLAEKKIKSKPINIKIDNLNEL